MRRCDGSICGIFSGNRGPLTIRVIFQCISLSYSFSNERYRLMTNTGKRLGTRYRFAGALLTLLLLLPASLGATPQSTHAQGRFAADNAKTFNPQVDRSMDHVPGEVLIKLREPGTPSSRILTQMMDCFNLAVADEVVPGVYKLSAADANSLDVNAAVTALKSTGLVAYAQPNNVYYADQTPNDPQYAAGQQWSLTQIQAEQAWDITTGSTNIVVAILDTGTATDHPDLQEKIVPGYDFYNNDDNPYDDFGHGTMTAGIVGAISNNGEGVAGVSSGARIMPVKVLGGRNGSGSDEMVARGIRWAVDHGANIINASLGGGDTSPVQDDAVKYAHDHNVLFVAAAGNTPDGKPHYPAANDTVLSVGATGRVMRTGFSSYGPYVDISAPGVGILSTTWGGDGGLGCSSGNGTSFSCPIVSGVAALVWSDQPFVHGGRWRYILEDSADDVGPVGYDEYSGRGRVNALRAVQLAQQGPPPRPVHPHHHRNPPTHPVLRQLRHLSKARISSLIPMSRHPVLC